MSRLRQQTYHEIAEELGVTDRAVERHISRLTCSPDCYQSEVESGSFMMVD
ncbi:sigma factor-like helix-turn-helix DNA-binding protein [Sphingopyxis sp. LARHCG72]